MLARPLLRYALARTGSLVLAEDLAQEALTALVARWRRLGPPDSAAAFAFSIVRRRATRAQLRSLLFEPLDKLFAASDLRHNPEEDATLKERVSQARGALERLSPGEREALLLVVWGELRLKDAARVLRISDSAMKMRVQRARNRLRTIVEPEYESA